MHEDIYIAWAMQTSKKWSDLAGVLKRTGIDFVDHDHKTLVEFSLKLNSVLDDSEKGFSIAIINEIKLLLNQIYNYTKEHFDREEAFMVEYDLPRLNEHKIEHSRILRMLEEVTQNFNSGKLNIARYLKINILDWLIKHVNTADIGYFSIESWGKNIIKANEWDDINAIIRLIGIDEIDVQHKHMTNLALSKINGLNVDFSNEKIDDMVVSLLDYAKFHFDYEERFMAENRITNIDRHVGEHNYFTGTISKYGDILKEDKDKILEMKEWLVTWWINHINKTDSEYFSYRNWGYQRMERSEKAEDVKVLLRMTGNAQIDQEHLELMEKTFSLYRLTKLSIEEGTNQSIKQKAIALFDEIQKAAKTHFEHEEELMLNARMEDYEYHSQEHRDILKKITELKENYQRDRLVLSQNIKTMLLEWWISHTNTTDYRTFVHNPKRKEFQTAKTSRRMVKSTLGKGGK